MVKLTIKLLSNNQELWTAVQCNPQTNLHIQVLVYLHCDVCITYVSYKQ